MSQLEAIKHQFHDLIDRIDDENVLTHYLGALYLEVRDTIEWPTVTSEEKARILKAYEESKDLANWIL